VGLCEDARVPANQTHDREAARTRIFDGAQTLAAALMKCDRSERWEPLRDLILAGLEAGGLRNAPTAPPCGPHPQNSRRRPLTPAATRHNRVSGRSSRPHARFGLQPLGSPGG
jgi:hypothetical protein